MRDLEIPHAGEVLEGPLFTEPMRVEAVRWNGLDAWLLDLIGTQTQKFRRCRVTYAHLEQLQPAHPPSRLSAAAPWAKEEATGPRPSTGSEGTR
ncbi:MAG: hypothetical protein KGJ23_05000 [Euryarchaeota archaeon]|nr:hypothetical protein [Euryarchaeota archaeon]MDE1835956.1 hypothetical protein [Euryarchaeota archaeon]MDE1880628.1 hypothetical protein [Euryarchaeota archaeon]MDE2044366.1 hypothetical protein [Thermoplasmata archaeon]